MKNFLKKAAAMALSVGMMLASAGMPVFAAGTDLVDTSVKCSLTITKYDQTAYEDATGNSVDDLNVADGEQDTDITNAMAGYELEGVQFGVHKVGDMYTYSQNGTIVVVYSIPSDLQSVLGLKTADAVMQQGSDYCFTSDQINNAMKALLTENTDGKNKLETWWASEGITKYYGETDADGVVTFSNLDQGLYLVVETDVPEEVYSTTDPFFVSLPMTNANIAGNGNTQVGTSADEGNYWFYDVYVYPKNQTNNPTIDKVVLDDDDKDELIAGTAEFTDTVSASEGDVLDYRIVIKMPTITSMATYLTTFTVNDTQADGMYYNDDVKILWYNNVTDAYNDINGTNAVYTWAHGSYNFGVQYSNSANAGSATVNVGTMTITMTETGLKAINNHDTTGGYTSLYSDYSDLYMVVVYSSTVYSSAAVELGDANKTAAVDADGNYIANGNENNAALTYSRSYGDPSYNSSYSSNTLQDTSKVFTYGISGYFTTVVDSSDYKPLKTFSTTSGDNADEDATAVQFVLYNQTEGYYVPVTTTDNKSGVSTAGVYFVTDDLAKYHINMVDLTTGEFEDLISGFTASDVIFSPDAKGYLRVSGLEAGTYILSEIKTVSGYSLLKDDIEIVITGTDVDITAEVASVTGTDLGNGVNKNLEPTYTQNTTASATVDLTAADMGNGSTDSANGYVMLSIENTANFELPKTGGLGTILFTLAGAGIVLCGVAFLTRDKKKAEA